MASFIFSPYSGVEQSQAARIAVVVTDGMARIQQRPAQPEREHFKEEKMETKEELESNNQESLPLDLSVK